MIFIKEVVYINLDYFLLFFPFFIILSRYIQYFKLTNNLKQMFFKVKIFYQLNNQDNKIKILDHLMIKFLIRIFLIVNHKIMFKIKDNKAVFYIFLKNLKILKINMKFFIYYFLYY